MEIALIIFGIFVLMIFFYYLKKSKNKSNKDIYPHF